MQNACAMIPIDDTRTLVFQPFSGIRPELLGRGRHTVFESDKSETVYRALRANEGNPRVPPPAMSPSQESCVSG